MGFGKDGKGVIMRESRSQALTTLAVNTAIFIGTKLVTLERYRMIKLELTAGINGVTSNEGSNLVIGICDGDLSLAEIEAAIEGAGPLGPNDSVQEAISERYVKMLGSTNHMEADVEAMFLNKMGGPIIEETIRWTFARTKSWNYFVYNMGSALASGSLVSIRVKSFGVWVL